MIRKLEIGPGKKRPYNHWITLDCEERPGVVDVICRWGEEPLPFPDNCIEFVYTSHVLEHIPWYRTIDALREVRRVLYPGATIEIHVPDLDVLIEAVQKRQCLDNHAEDGINSELHWMHWVAERLFHLGPERQWHRACFNASHLAWCFEQAGFRGIQQMPRDPDGSHGLIDLGMQAVK